MCFKIFGQPGIYSNLPCCYDFSKPIILLTICSRNRDVWCELSDGDIHESAINLLFTQLKT